MIQSKFLSRNSDGLAGWLGTSDDAVASVNPRLNRRMRLRFSPACPNAWSLGRLDIWIGAARA